MYCTTNYTVNVMLNKRSQVRIQLYDRTAVYRPVVTRYSTARARRRPQSSAIQSSNSHTGWVKSSVAAGLESNHGLYCWSDASYGEERSHTGYAVIYMNAAVCWASRKLKVIALSSTEAEISAGVGACKDLKFVKRNSSQSVVRKVFSIEPNGRALDQCPTKRLQQCRAKWFNLAFQPNGLWLVDAPRQNRIASSGRPRCVLRHPRAKGGSADWFASGRTYPILHPHQMPSKLSSNKRARPPCTNASKSARTVSCKEIDRNPPPSQESQSTPVIRPKATAVLVQPIC